MKQVILSLATLVISLSFATAQYWQQAIDYKMDIQFDHLKHQYQGEQDILYQNNSPDTLYEVFYHLYYRAFQPGSMMDVRSQNIVDPDRRVGNRIASLQEDEIGFHEIQSLMQDDQTVQYEIIGTVMKVRLDHPILPNSQTKLSLRWNSQVPVQIRRTGRNNIEGIDYSMAQWYPKLAEYDDDGWHAIQYVAREFHGVWGNFDVSITIDSSYTIGATGILQNPGEIGKGYGTKTTHASNSKLTWHFKAENVIDFVWAADPDYIHTTHTAKDGVEFHFFYQNDTNIIANWEELPAYTIRCFEIMEKLFGKYPYPAYSVIQGGDGGMEYPMATLILGNGSKRGLIGVTVHEALHSWFQAILATNEGKYPWMDEGFNTYYNHLVIDSLFGLNPEFPHRGSYTAFFKLVEKDLFEPISTHADHYHTNKAYGTAAYAMGAIFLNQLNYIVGRESFDQIMHTYWKKWQFKHPSPRDFKKMAENVSGMQLDWYFNYFLETTNTIDYGVKEIEKNGKNTLVHLQRLGDFPMPVDLSVEFKDGSIKNYTIPLTMMMQGKKMDGDLNVEVLPFWPWTHPDYSFEIEGKAKDIKQVQIDPTQRMADINRANNIYPIPE